MYPSRVLLRRRAQESGSSQGVAQKGAVTAAMDTSSLNPPKAVEPVTVMPRQAPSSERVRYTTRGTSGAKVEYEQDDYVQDEYEQDEYEQDEYEQDEYEPLGYPNEEIYENPA